MSEEKQKMEERLHCMEEEQQKRQQEATKKSSVSSSLALDAIIVNNATMSL